MNRAARRAAAAKQRRQATTPQDHPSPALDRASVLRLFAGMAVDNPRISGATMIEPDGAVTFFDAGALCRGGRA
jgi:hypothetical protein